MLNYKTVKTVKKRCLQSISLPLINCQHLLTMQIQWNCYTYWGSQLSKENPRFINSSAIFNNGQNENMILFHQDPGRRSIKLNPIDQFVVNNHSIRCIGLNGGKAFELFERHFIKTDKFPSNINYIQLPSTSPANARLNNEQKYQLWQDKLKQYI